MGCGMSIVQYVLFVFNLLCALFGIALVAVGAGFLLKYEEILDAFKDVKIGVAPIAFIIIGSIIFLIAFFGCCGAILESSWMVSTYACLLFLLLVLQIVIGVLMFTNKREVTVVAERTLRNLWNEKERYHLFWDTMQQGLQCCGLDTSTQWVPRTPASCCDKNVIECLALVNAYQTGCLQKLNEFLTKSSNIFGSTALAVAGIELLALIFACCLTNHIRNYKRRLAY